MLVSLIPLVGLGQSEGPDPRRCAIGSGQTKHCWGRVEYQNGHRYVGMLDSGKPQGDGILYLSDGRVKDAGGWSSGELVDTYAINVSRFPFEDTNDVAVFEAERARKYAEIERNRPPQQRVEFCIQTVQVSGTRHPSVGIPYCQEACSQTFRQSMCSQIGGSKWRVQAVSPKTSPPNSQYFSGFGNCSCIGQEYILNEIKEQSSPASVPLPLTDTREAELEKREKELAEREKVILEAENKRLREELEA